LTLAHYSLQWSAKNQHPHFTR